MSEALNKAAEALRAKVGSTGFDGSIKFEIDGHGAVRLADGGVAVDDGDADCTVSASLETFQDLFNGDLDPTAAFMTGKIRIDGDMGVALKLSQILA